MISMTIQTVFSPDNRAPKFNLGKPGWSTQLLTNKKFWIVVAGLSVLFLIMGVPFDTVFLIYLVVAILGFIASMIGSQLKAFARLIRNDKVPAYFQQNHDYFKQHLIQNYNFQVDYESVGILVDAQAGRIAFTLDPKVRPQVIVCDFVDVQRWQAYSQGVESQNQYGVTRSLISKHYVSVYIRHPDQPRYDFFAADSVDADQWVARLNALLN